MLRHNAKFILPLAHKNLKIMMWDVLSNEEKNDVLLKLLVYMSQTDRVLHESEFSYLIYVCNHLQIDPEELRKFEYVADIEKDILPTSEQDRVNILYHLLFVMNADDNISPEEEKAIYHLAFKLGFGEETTRDFINLMKQYKLNELPPGSMLKILNKFQN